MIAVAVPPLSTDLTTVQACLDDLGIGSDPRLPALIRQASAVACSYCGRSFAQTTWIETFLTTISPLVLSRTPISAVASVVYNDIPLDPSAWLVDPNSGLLYDQVAATNDGYWLTRNDYYQRVPMKTLVTYTAGYLLPNDLNRTLPDDVERAVIELVKTMWYSSGGQARDPFVRSETIDGIGSTAYRDPVTGSYGMSSMAADLLIPYRRVC